MDILSHWGAKALALLLGGGTVAGGATVSALGSSNKGAQGVTSSHHHREEDSVNTRFSGAVSSKFSAVKKVEKPSRHVSSTNTYSYRDYSYRQPTVSNDDLEGFSYTFVDKNGKWSCRRGPSSMDAYSASLNSSSCSETSEHKQEGKRFELWVKGNGKKLEVNRWDYSEMLSGDTWFKQLLDRIFRNELKLGWDRKTKVPMECKLLNSDTNTGMESWHCYETTNTSTTHK